MILDRSLPVKRFKMALSAIALALTCAGLSTPSEAQSRSGGAQAPIRITDAGGAREIRLQMSKSVILELPRDAADILVSNPAIGNAIVRSQRRIFLLGTGIGSTNIFFFDADGRQIASVDLVVERDLEGLNRTLRRVFPSSVVRAEAIGDNVLITGTVNSPADAQQVIQISERFVGQLGSSAATATGGGAAAPGTGSTNSSRVINALTIIGKDQVQLRVVVAEINRRAARQLGIDFNSLVNIAGPGGSVFGRIAAASTAVFPLNPSANVATGNLSVPLTSPRGQSLNGTLRTLEEVGLFKTLAEPNLTAISGEQATFLAGGEFPIPVSRDVTGNIGIEFRPFGVSLAFTPVVLSEGRISLKVRSEVSELSNRGLTLNGFNIPGFNVRRADSTVELPSGGSIAMAGLIRDDMRKTITGVPLLRQLPILGRLFSSQDFINEQTELLIIVTPYIVNPVSRRELAAPTDGFAPPSDPEAILFGRLNRTFPNAPRTAQGAPPPATVQRRFGFIYE
jgi:pilus assembly protein CpaC